VERGHAYSFNHPEYTNSILYIRRLYRASSGARVKFSEIKLMPGDDDTEGLLSFSEWDECGREADAATLVFDPRRHPIEEEFQIACPRLPASPHRPHQHNVKRVKVEWACSRSGTELRHLKNVGTRVSIAAGDSERLSRPWTVHEYNCGMGENTAALIKEGLSVTVGVEQDDILGKTWLVISL
jgi:hypothetical protein